MKLNQTLWILFFLNICCFIPAYAQFSPPTTHDAPALKFEHVSSHEGLNQHTITRLFTDKAGMLWVGTQDGLHSYNGRRFHLFGHDADNPKSISEGFITDIVQDEDNFIWVATHSQGLNRLNLKTGDFTRYGRAQGLQDLRTTQLSILGNSIWVGTQTGLYTLSSKKNSLQKIPLGNSISPEITSLASVGSDYLIVGTRQSGVFAIGPNTISRLQLPQSLSVNQIKVQDSNTLILALANQLWRYKIDERSGEKLWQRPSSNIGSRHIEDFSLSNKNDEIWLVGPNSGLIRLIEREVEAAIDGGVQKTQWRAYAYLNDPLRKYSLADNNIRTLLLDNNGVLWLGSSFSGIDKVNIDRQFFQHMFEHHRLNPRQSNNIRALLRDEMGTLWIGTQGAGPKRHAPGNRFYQHFSELFNIALDIKEPLPLSILDIKQDHQGNLWFASNYGLGKLTPDQDFTLYQQDEFRTNALTTGMIRALDVDDLGQLRISIDGRLYLYRPASDDFKEIPLNQVTGYDNILNQIFVLRSKQDTLWLGTSDGLIQFNINSHKGKIYRHGENKNQGLINSRVRDILFASDASIWIATHGGISHMTPSGEDFRIENYHQSKGLPSSTVYALLEDDDGQIWFSSNSGISRLSPDNGTIITFNEAEGLQDLEFNGKVKMKDDDGQLWFGGINGINHFYPETLPKVRAEAPLALTGYRIAGNYKRILDLQTPPEIVMNYDDQAINFEVASLDYSYSDKDHFAFMLEGFDSKWNHGYSSSDITYTNLSPGHYTLKVRYGLQDNPLGKTVLEVPLDVLAPFYRTHLAYFIYFTVFSSFLFWLFLLRLKKTRQQEEFETSIRSSEERLKLALWASGDGMWDWNIDEDKVYRTDLIGNRSISDGDATLIDNIHPEGKYRVKQALAYHLKGRTPFYEAEYRVEQTPGNWIWLLDRGKVVEVNAKEEPIRMTGTHKDITKRKTTEDSLRLSAQVLHSMNEAVVVGSLDYKIASVNPAFTLITGYAADDVMNRPFLYLTRGRYKRQFYETIEKQLLNDKRWSGEIKVRTRTGRNILVWLEINQVIDSKEEASHFVAVFTDITDRKKAEEDLRVLASYDTLTGLPNRTLFHDRLAHAIHQAHRSKNIVGLMFLDLDRFKHINDSMGHHVGDLLLKAVASRLKNSVREGDTVARLGGDEFTIIIEGANKTKVATIISEKLIRAFQTPFLLDDKVLTISPSIGISIYPDDAEDSSSLIKYADTAMYHAKSSGRNNFQFYTPKLNEYAVRHVELEAGLKQAISRNEFHLVYQPKFCVATGKLTGLEALLRWESKELGSISPAEFIPLAEETGIINQIGHWVINHACSQIAQWHEQGFTELNVAINLSANQLKADIISTIEVALAVSGLPAHVLELELTESMIMKNPKGSVKVLNQLKALGLTLAVDDFGTGYSSLSYLKRFPIDTLKIDREFVGDISDDPEDAAITSAIIALGHSLDLQVVAEGVETQEQLNFLAEHDCDQVQGYLLSKPLSADDCQQFLQLQGRVCTGGNVPAEPSETDNLAKTEENQHTSS